mgnify:CR=1 FL=1
MTIKRRTIEENLKRKGYETGTGGDGYKLS